MSLLDDELEVMDRTDEVVLYTIQSPPEDDVENLKRHIVNYTEAWYNVLLDLVCQFENDAIKLINIGQVLQILKDNYWKYSLAGGLLAKCDHYRVLKMIDHHISRTILGENSNYYKLTNFDTFIISLFDCYGYYSRSSFNQLTELYKYEDLYNEYRDRIWKIIEHNGIKIKRTLY